jgi:hypothetical protein
VLIAADLGSAVSIGSAAVGALVAILGVMGYQNRRARLSAIRTAFNDVVGALASEDARQQLAAAVLLRRFFDPKSELGARDLLGRRRTPYSEEALNVIAAVPSGVAVRRLAEGPGGWAGVFPNAQESRSTTNERPGGIPALAASQGNAGARRFLSS